MYSDSAKFWAYSSFKKLDSSAIIAWFGYLDFISEIISASAALSTFVTRSLALLLVLISSLFLDSSRINFPAFWEIWIVNSKRFMSRL